MKTHIMKTEDKHEHADRPANAAKALCSRILEKTLEGAKASEEMFQRHTHKLLAAGMLLGMATGYLVSQRCRRHSR
jgi:hypothetical protein